MPRYRFDQADVVLSLGKDFLGASADAVESATDWAKKRKLVAQSGSTIRNFRNFSVSKAPSRSPARTRMTGYPIRPGDELKVALAIANELMER